MVSRSNLSGRAPMGGVLGRAYKGPSGPGKVTPPGMENRARRAKRQVLNAGDEGPIEMRGAMPVQGSGAQSPKRGGFLGKARNAIEQQRTRLEAERAAKYPTTSPGVGETAYRPGFTDKDAKRIRKDELRRMSKPERKAAKRQDVFARMQEKFGGKKKRGGIGGMVRSALEQQRGQQDALNAPPVDTTQIGIRESLGDAYVEPGTRPALGGPGSPGGNETTGVPRRRGSAASRSRRNIR